MNRLFKFFFIMFFVMIGIGTTNAQVEIVSSDLNYISGNDISSQSSHDPIEIDLGEAGANQSWDFSGIELEGEHIDHIRDTEGKPGADSFPTANIVAYEVPEDDEWWLYSYFNVNENNVNVLGMVIVLNEPDTTMIWEVETIGNAYNFPLAYNDEWSYVLNLGTDEDINIDSVHCVVDAWGEITDLAGTYDCIRIQRFTRSFEQNGDEIETETHYNYIWLAPDFGDIVSISSEDGEENPDFTNGEFHRTTGIE
ncbi:MAG: hypothetical protein HQ568_04770, partial [Calditrichaeota bacterium]|nr:hypothetical protein [Calditrichota bacterium]